MYKSIVIIGLGSLGGFIAENVSRIKGLQTLILIDPDIVEYKNIKKSIYRIKDIGKFKVEALKDIIQTDYITIKTYPIEYIEGKIYLPSSDLIIDCRDEICSRGGEIDVRFYISYRTLVIDCEKFHKINCIQTGKYSQLLSLIELSTAASIASQYVNDKILKEFIRKGLVYQAPIDLVKQEANKAIDLYNKKPDLIIDYYKGQDKIRNLHENLPKLINVNKTKDLTVVIGQESCVGSHVQLIKRNEINEFNNAVEVLSEIVQNIVPQKEYYTIRINDDNLDEVYIELLPETGAA